MRDLDVELLWWEGCPSTERALAAVREALTDVGLGDVPVQMREIRTDDDALESEFVGSPTILIDGADLVPAGDDEPAASAAGCTGAETAASARFPILTTCARRCDVRPSARR